MDGRVDRVKKTTEAMEEQLGLKEAGAAEDLD
jgi:hypothetical protein